jgi:hypothetical protein
MVNEKISEWIREGLKKGYTTAELRKKLIEKGYSEKQIDNALEKRKIVVLIIPIIIILLLICGAVYYFGYNKDVCKGLTEKSSKDECYCSLAEKNPSYLEKISAEFRNICSDRIAAKKSQCENAIDKDACYIYEATIVAKDASICEKIKYAENKNNCLAISTNNASLCLGEGRDGCIFRIASQINDYSLCAEIEDMGLKEECTSVGGIPKY